MTKKEYSSLEQKLYKTPDQEAAFLSGAFQTVAMSGISVGMGWIPGVLFMLVTDRYFSKPFRDDKGLRSSNLKGWIAGFATSLAVLYGVNAYMEEPAEANDQPSGRYSEATLPAPQAIIAEPA